MREFIKTLGNIKTPYELYDSKNTGKLVDGEANFYH